MTLKKWLYLFLTTLSIGGAAAVITGFFMQWDVLTEHGAGNFVAGLIANFWIGLMYSAVSQMGFFAYLTVNMFASGLFRKKETWQLIQVGIIMFVFFDTVYLRYAFFGEGESWVSFLGWPSLLLAVAVVAAYFKARATSPDAFIPAMFFVFVGTLIEWVPALRENNINSMIFMLVPLLSCNIWQLMQLHKLIGNKASQPKAGIQKS
ncbi:MAG: KinB-signaling pathway activation protein [Bacillaceae bacterium]|nr:KinB-signaling pathway activation protein [Bacillaceae bacterium]